MDIQSVKMEAKNGVLITECVCGKIKVHEHHQIRDLIIKCDCGHLAYIPTKLLDIIQCQLFDNYLFPKKPTPEEVGER
jgi:hypothetical protein